MISYYQHANVINTSQINETTRSSRPSCFNVAPLGPNHHRCSVGLISGDREGHSSRFTFLIKPFSDSWTIFSFNLSPIEPPSPSAALNGHSCVAGIWPGDNLNLMVSWAQFSQVKRNPIYCLFLRRVEGVGLVTHFVMLQTFAIHSREKHCHIKTKCQQLLFVLPSVQKLSTEWKNLTYFQRPDSRCCSSLLTD